jgi:hypothetical protein
MGKKYKHLFEKIIQPDNLWCAYQKTARGKRTTLEYLVYRQQEASNLKALHQLLLSGQYLPTPPRQFQVFEPKLQLIEAIVPPTGTGLPIGSLSSQLFANVYGNIVDQWLVHTVGEGRFVRYMDDIVILAHAAEYLHALRLRLAWFAEAELGLKFSHWSVQPISRGVNFVGYRIWTTHKLLRKASVQRAKRTLKCLPVASEARQKFLAAWRGHAKHADSYNLRKYLGVL